MSILDKGWNGLQCLIASRREQFRADTEATEDEIDDVIQGVPHRCLL